MGYEKSDSAKPVESSSNVSDLDIVEGMTGVGTVTVASGLVFVGEAVFEFVFVVVVVVDIVGVVAVVFVAVTVVVVAVAVAVTVVGVVVDVVFVDDGVNVVVVVVFLVAANGVVVFVFLGVALGCSLGIAVLAVGKTASSTGLDMDFALVSFVVEFGFAFLAEYFEGMDLLSVCD